MRQNKQLANYEPARSLSLSLGAARHNLDRRVGQRRPASTTPTIVKPPGRVAATTTHRPSTFVVRHPSPTLWCLYLRCTWPRVASGRRSALLLRRAALARGTTSGAVSRSETRRDAPFRGRAPSYIKLRADENSLFLIFFSPEAQFGRGRVTRRRLKRSRGNIVIDRSVS